MPRRCDLTGTGNQSGHNVSHSNRKTNRRFQPNLQQVTLYSDALSRPVPLRITTRALRTVQKRGGLDAYLLKSSDAVEYWTLFIELESGHRISQRFLLTNAGPGERNALALGHVMRPDGTRQDYHNGRFEPRWTL